MVLPEGREGEALAGLPLRALRLAPEALASAARFGIERIADLYPMPRGPLARRLGCGAVERLDQARGFLPEPIVPVVPFDMPCAERRLLEPIATAEAIEQVISDLVADLVADLRERGLGLRAAVLRCERVDAREQLVTVGTARATRDAKHLVRLFRLRIDRIEPGLGIEAMALAAPQVEPLGAEVIGTGFDSGPRAPDLAPLVDQLAGRAGEGALFRLEGRESDVPERAIGRTGPLAQPSGWPAWPRPIRMLARPEVLSSVVALLPDHRLRLTLDLAQQLIGTPRHLSQHPGGFVLTQERLDDLVPIEPARMEGRQIIEWDKDDIDVLKFMKVDVLGLGMLGCMTRPSHKDGRAGAPQGQRWRRDGRAGRRASIIRPR